MAPGNHSGSGGGTFFDDKLLYGEYIPERRSVSSEPVVSGTG